MTCQTCKKDGLPVGERGCQVCWCGIDICADCLDEHGKECEWMQRMRVKPEKQKPRATLPVIGMYGSAKRRKRRR